MLTLPPQGAICLDTLGNGWSPVGTIKMALLSLRMLLEVPNPKDPQDAEVAKMMLETPNAFTQKAHDWAVMYAGAPRAELILENFDKKVVAEVKKDDPGRYEAYQSSPTNTPSRPLTFLSFLPGIKVTIRTSSTGLCSWASMLTPLSMPSTSLESTETGEKTMSWKKLTWEISPPGFSASSSRRCPV